MKVSPSSVGAALRAAAGTLNLHAAASFVDDRLSAILSTDDSSHSRHSTPSPPPPPHLVFLFAFCSSALLFALVARLRRFLYRVEARGGAVQCSLDFFKSLPFVRGLLKKEMVSMERRLRASLPARPPSLPRRTALPLEGSRAEDVLSALVEAAKGDGDGSGRLSGALYLPREGEVVDGEDGEFVVVFDEGGHKEKEKEKKKSKKSKDAPTTTTAKKDNSSSSPSSSAPLTHSTLLNAAYAAFAHTNPMHSSVFPAAVCLERDIVSMTASILSGSTDAAEEAENDGNENERVRGQVTSGGSESIILAVLAARELSFREGRCVRFGDEGRRPEIVLAASAHAAFFKAAHYFGMRVRVVKPSSSSSSASSSSSSSSAAVAPRLTGGDVRRHLTRNTALVVASAPSFPHGIVDDVVGIARETSKRGVPLHVDCCLGGFVLAFAKEAASSAHAELPKKATSANGGNDDSTPSPSSSSTTAATVACNNNRRRQTLRFDFSVPGVTSISADVHKFGLSHKGTSVLLFKGCSSSSGRIKIDGAALRRSAFVATSDWPGGLYVSPGVAGSRSGALLAAAWASMVHVGREGYVAAARSIFAEVDAFIAGIERAAGNPADPLSELEVIKGDDDGDGDDEGLPLGPVVAFRARAPSSSSSSPQQRRCPLNVYVLNDMLSERHGWHLNALQRPPALHCCFTAQHARGGARRLLADLGAAVRLLRERERAREKEEEEEEREKGTSKKKKKAKEEEGMAPIYGMASASPDRGLVGEFLLTFQDVLLTG